MNLCRLCGSLAHPFLPFLPCLPPTPRPSSDSFFTSVAHTTHPRCDVELPFSLRLPSDKSPPPAGPPSLGMPPASCCCCSLGCSLIPHWVSQLFESFQPAPVLTSLPEKPSVSVFLPKPRSRCLLWDSLDQELFSVPFLLQYTGWEPSPDLTETEAGHLKRRSHSPAFTPLVTGRAGVPSGEVEIQSLHPAHRLTCRWLS